MNSTATPPVTPAPNRSVWRLALYFIAAFFGGLPTGAAFTFAVDILPRPWTRAANVFYIWFGLTAAAWIIAAVMGALFRRWGWCGFFVGAGLFPIFFAAIIYVLGSTL